jgi:hypothetical protein
LQNPLRGIFRETALAGASNNDGNDGHAFYSSLLAERKKVAAQTRIKMRLALIYIPVPMVGKKAQI